MATRPWYEEFFEDVYPETQPRKAGRPEAEGEVDFLVRELGLAPGMRLLDLGCGAGYHAIPLARRGLQVTGVDLSQRMLSEAQQAAQDAGVTVAWERRDMQDLPWESTFNAVISMFTSFGYLPGDAANFRVLQAMARALVPGGRLCLHVASYPFLLRNWQAKSWTRGESGSYRLERSRLDLSRAVVEVRCTVVRPDGTQSETLNQLRMFAPHELIDWITRAGLRCVAAYGDFAARPITLESASTIVIAEKT